MTETDPIIIRIQALDEATQIIEKVSGALKQLEVRVPKIDLGVTQFEKINTILPKTNQQFKSNIQSVGDIGNAYSRWFDTMQPEPIERLNQSLQIAGISSKEFATFLKKSNMEVIAGVGVYDKLTGAVITQGQAVKLATIQGRRFKMEWLSIMFSGMALSRAFNGIVSAQMQLYGITDTMASMWTVVMGPAMDLISEKLYNIMDAVMALPPNTQMAIGLTVLGFDWLGKIVSGIGQVFLAGMGLKMLFPSIGAAVAEAGGGISGVFGAIGTAIAGVGATVLIVVAVILVVILVVIAGIYLAWKTNFLNIKAWMDGWWNGIKQLFGGIISVITGILDVVIGLFTGDFTKVKDGIVKIFTGIWNFLSGGFKTVFDTIAIIIIGALKIVYNIIKVIVDAVIWVADKISKIGGGKGISWKMPSFKEGGIMPYTGVAMLHAGEKVIPRNEVNQSSGDTNVFSPNIVLNATVSNDYDVRKLATQLNQYWAQDFQRAIKGRAR